MRIWRPALGDAQLELDRGLADWLVVGVCTGATVRAETLGDEGYERWTAGLRLTATC